MLLGRELKDEREHKKKLNCRNSFVHLHLIFMLHEIGAQMDRSHTYLHSEEEIDDMQNNSIFELF
jgi:hypothetical protein